MLMALIVVAILLLAAPGAIILAFGSEHRDA
jgi:hypothetical protein